MFTPAFHPDLRPLSSGAGRSLAGRFLFCALNVMLLGTVSLWASERNPPPVSLGNNPGMQGITYGFFDDRTGEKQGRLHIARVVVESRREGFLRVGWKPLVVLEGVTLDISAGALWPETGRQILAALRGSARDAFILRNVHLRIAGAEPRELNAPAGRLRPDGALELTFATVAPGSLPPPEGPATLCYWLVGPQAGELVPGVAAAAAPRAPVSAGPAKSQALN